jgi:putative ABC transport system permease protein
MLQLAIANLVQNKTRLLISAGGVGLALTLVLFFSAIFKGAEGRLTVYVDNAGADIWVSQEGVRTMHMSESAIPLTTLAKVKAVPGVADAVPVLYATDILQANGNENIVYVFGVQPDARLGAPWNVTEGVSQPGHGEIIIDHAIASQLGVGLGDHVTAIGQQLTVVGMMSGTASVVSAVSFVRFDDFAAMRRSSDAASYILVKVAPGESVAAVRDRIANAAPGVTVQTKEQFASNERSLVKDMSADLISIINDAGYVTGLAVVALTIYVATVARRKEYGVLKAMGVRNLRLFEIVVVQALLTVAIGFLTGLGITLLLSVLIPQFNELMVITVGGAELLQVGVISLVIAGLAALLPASQLAGLEPVQIIRRG